MGCDIHSYAEVRKDGQWQKVGEVFPLDEFGRDWHKKTHTDKPFDWRNYGLFGFLAGVRNYSAITPLSEPKGLPDDLSSEVHASAEHWDADGHSHSWLSLRELLAPDYESQVWDRRYTRQEGPNFFNGGATAAATETHLGTRESLRHFLGDRYFEHLDVLKSLGQPDDVRIIFWFDN